MLEFDFTLVGSMLRDLATLAVTEKEKKKKRHSRDKKNRFRGTQVASLCL